MKLPISDTEQSVYLGIRAIRQENRTALIFLSDGSDNLVERL